MCIQVEIIRRHIEQFRQLKQHHSLPEKEALRIPIRLVVEMIDLNGKQVTLNGDFQF
jgi:hypothetical protein